MIRRAHPLIDALDPDATGSSGATSSERLDQLDALTVSFPILATAAYSLGATLPGEYGSENSEPLLAGAPA